MIFDHEAIHLMWDDSTRGGLRQAFRMKKGDIVGCRDNLAFGRQTITARYPDWYEARKAALADICGDDYVQLFEGSDFSLCFDNFELLRDDRPLLIWADGLLATQMMIAFVCHHLTANNFGTDRLHIVRYTQPTAGFTFAMLTGTAPDDMQRHRPETQHLSLREVEAYARIWLLFCSSSAADHVTLVADETIKALALGATTPLLNKYPSRNSGLTNAEMGLVQAALRHQTKTVRIIGDVMGHNETPDRFGDLYLYNRLLGMGHSRLPQPLFRFEFEDEDRNMRVCKTHVLPVAHDILAGRKNMIELNGIDQWIGGVHLTPDTIVYREDLQSMAAD